MQRIVGLTALFLFALPAAALAVDSPQPTLALPTTQVWVLAIGALVPLVTYALNHAGPWVTEPVKAFVLVVAAAVAGGVTQAINAGSVGFNQATFQLVLSAVVAAFAAHHFLWKPSGISEKLGAGSNAPHG